MNNYLPKLVSFVLLFFTVATRAQTFSASYSFSGVNNGSGRTDQTPVPTAAGVTFGSFMAVAPAGNPNSLGANPNASGRFSFAGWPTGAVSGSDVFTGSLNDGQYYEVTITPQPNYTLKIDSISFTLQRSGTGIRQYAVRSSADNFAVNLPALIEPLNGNLQVVSGNVFQVTDASTTAQDGSKLLPAGIINLASPLTLRFYGWNAEATSGTFSIDNVKIVGATTLSVTAPNIRLTPATLSFAATAVNTNSQPLMYTVQATNLTDPLIINATPPFSIATSADGVFGSSISLAAAAVLNPDTIYVRFTPAAGISYTGAITHNSTGAPAQSVALSGDGIDPNNLVFNFNLCAPGATPGSGFTVYSVSGARNWACSAFGINNTNGVDINGFSGGLQENEDWLISPPLNLAAVNLPVLRFLSRGEFSGPTLQLLISTDYNGTGNPNAATWTDLQANFPVLNNTWTLSDGINLSAYKSNPNVYIAFKYLSSEELGAARWTIDNVEISNRTNLIAANPLLLNFGEVSEGNNSETQTFSVQSIGYNDINISAPAGYQLSLNNQDFSGNLSIPISQAQAGTTVYARFSPTTMELKVEGLLRITGSGLDTGLVRFTGSSYPRRITFDVGTYNLSFFGSNPTNTPTAQKITAQVANIATVVQRLNLDVIGCRKYPATLPLIR